MRHQRIVVSRYGGPDALQLIEEEVPEPKAGEVRVKVLAAGVSMPDVMAREGIHPETPRVPYTPGWDLATLLDLLCRQQIRPIVAARLPISEARRAHELLSKGGVIGKIVLVPAVR